MSTGHQQEEEHQHQHHEQSITSTTIGGGGGDRVPSSSTSTVFFTDDYSPTSYSPPPPPSSSFSLNHIHAHREQGQGQEGQAQQQYRNSSSSSSIMGSSNNNNNHHFPHQSSSSSGGGLPHAAIKIIPEDVELSSGMHRSRSSSVQLHLPALINSSSSSSNSASSSFSNTLPNGNGNPHIHLNGSSPTFTGPNGPFPSSSSSPAVSRSNSPNNPATAGGPIFQASINGAPLTSSTSSSSSSSDSSNMISNFPNSKPGTSNSTNGNNNQFNLHLLPKVHEEEEVPQPLRSPSMLKPFRPNPQLVRRRGGTVYVFAIIGGAFTLFILFVVLLSGGGSGAGSGPNSVAGRLRKHSPGQMLAPYYNAATAASGSSSSLARLSSYLGSYLPFLDTYYNSAAMISLTSSAYLFGHTASGVHTLHPILPLLKGASLRANDLVSRQSSTLSQAVAQYRKRYKKDPPKGFDKWWSFAKARNHTLVDEYDSLMRDIGRFATLSPHVLRTRTRTLAQLQSVSLITIKGGKAQIHSKSGKWAPALALQEMMNAFVSTLPDMEIAVNEKPEGRVLPGQWKEVNLDEWEDEDFPLQTESEKNQTDPLASLLETQGFKSEWRRDGSVWEAFRRACPPESAARRLVESVRSAESSMNSRQMRLQVPSAAQQQQSDVYYTSALSRRRAESSGALPRTRELSFNSDVDAALDICSFPSLHTMHSAFYSDTRSIQHLYPLFSPSKPNGYADLLIPFHQYWAPPSEVTYENEFRKGRSKTPMDVEWDQKDDKVYWRGKVLRGAENPPGHFSSFQKPRLVKLANDDGSYFTGKEDTPSWRKITPTVPPHRVLVTVNATSSSLLSMSAPGPRINEYVMDVALSCDPQLGECAEQQRLGYKVLPPTPLSDSWKHKYVVDLDEVGLSPKFPAVIESKSAVVKSSVQREFWQDWIVPWYHYIPLSSSYAELYNIQAFFSGFPKQFRNRRATSASSPQQQQKDTNPNTVEADKIVTDAEAAVDEAANAYTITSEMESLSPINPKHGAVFNGDLALKDVAEQGSRWRTEHLRREDMEVYVFRLLLEWARLTSDDAYNKNAAAAAALAGRKAAVKQ